MGVINFVAQKFRSKQDTINVNATEVEQGKGAFELGDATFSPSLNKEDFIGLMLEGFISGAIDDTILPIEIKEEKDKSLMAVGFEFIKDENNNWIENNLIDHSNSLKEIILKSIYRPTTVYRIVIEGENYYFGDWLNYCEFKNNQLKINDVPYDVERIFRINRPMFNQILLSKPFELLYGFYTQIEFFSENSNLIVFNKNNLNKTMEGISADTIDDFLLQGVETFSRILQNKGGIIDSGDSIGFLNPAVGDIISAVDFVYSEMARILRMPKAELLGESPTGLNSGGVVEFQQVTYEKRKNDWRKRFVYPLLDGLEVEYNISGLSNAEKIELIKDFGNWASMVEPASPILFNYGKALVFEQCNITMQDAIKTGKDFAEEEIQPNNELEDILDDDSEITQSI